MSSGPERDLLIEVGSNCEGETKEDIKVLGLGIRWMVAPLTEI